MRIHFPLALVTLTLLAGCYHPNNPSSLEDRLTPPTAPMAAVVNAINANNEKIPSLWATLNYSATIHDNKQVHSVSSDDGVLLYQRPNRFKLVGKKEFVGTVFEVGSNDREYWLEVIPGTSRLWWGTYTDLARMTSEQLPIPIRPDLVMEVLGVGTINTDFNQLPVPTMRYVGSIDAYVFVFNVKAPDRWLAQKEVWYDRTTLRPRRVILYDSNGRPVLKADMSMDRKVQVPDTNPNDWPLVPGDYKLFFPDSGSRMEFSMKDVRLYKAGPHNLRIPNAASFNRPDVANTDIRETQIGGGGG
jgi:outer membrane lipoprotein-sorting protein